MSVQLVPHENAELLTVRIVEGELQVLRERTGSEAECVYSEQLG